MILEIGPGEGMLTKHLASRVSKLVVVEIDRRAVAYLKDLFPRGDVEIVHADFLQYDFTKVKRPIRVVGNIPYNLTSPILFHVIDHRDRIIDLTLMMQKEVASRIVARPSTKEYGILSVFCQVFADVKKLFDVSPNAFSPKPNVMSSVIHLAFLKSPRYPIADEEFFRGMVRGVFGKRRKTLRNSLKYFLEGQEVVIPSFPLHRRPEDLSVEGLVGLSNAVLAWRRSGSSN